MVHAGQAIGRFDPVAQRHVLLAVALVALAEVHRHALARAGGGGPRHRRPERADDHVAVRQVLGPEIRRLLERAFEFEPARRARTRYDGDFVTLPLQPVGVFEGDLDATPDLGSVLQ